MLTAMNGEIGELVAGGPRAAGDGERYATILETIAAGAGLHYDADGDGADLDLLRGDERYAAGLSLLAQLGDLDAVAELADLISLVAEAEAASDAELVAAIWQAGAVAIGWGGSKQLTEAKSLARSGDPRAAAALREAARARAGAQRPAWSQNTPDAHLRRDRP
jgi:hypothetical protein